jgi:hypothetical protein
MQMSRKQAHRLHPTKSGAVTLLIGCLLGAGSSRFLAAQTVNVSVSSSEIDQSMQSVIVFQSQTRERTDANIHVYDDLPAQQIPEFNASTPSGNAAQRPAVSDDSRAAEAPPSIDQEADILIVNPLKTGAKATSSAPTSDMDSMLMTQFNTAVKPQANRIESGVTGSDNLESLAFRNPDGTDVLFTVNHSRSPVSLEAFWKDRLFTYTQAGKSIAIYTWDPMSPLVSLVLRDPRTSPKGFISVEAKCSNISPVVVDLRCESQDFNCSIFPVRFTCNAQQDGVILRVTVDSPDKDDADHTKPGSVTITAAPDAGEPTSLSAPCCSARR